MRLIERDERGDELVLDLAEDLATRWVPDVLADVDLPKALRSPRLDAQDVRLVEVPRAEGGIRRAPVLSGQALGALRASVQPIRQIADDVLDPAVCGYRQGATGEVSYSEEYRRFRSFAEALSETSAWVVVADVANFFDSVSQSTVRAALRHHFEPAIEPLVDLISRLRTHGVPGLPAGYGDARLVANAVLAPVDEALGVPFARWIDDYRIFASSRAEADEVVCTLRKALDRVGLRVQDSKLEVMPSLDYRRARHGVPLDSVYHPQDEPNGVVRATLRSVFIDAVNAGDRRRLRFVLPRLGEQRDSSAVDYAFAALHSNSIDAPRLVHYLGAFVSDPAVASRARHLFADPGVSDWVLSRIAPLGYRINLDPAARDAVRDRAAATHSSLLWGLLVRLLAVHADTSVLETVARGGRGRDHRAAIGCYLDLDLPVPDLFRTPEAEPTIRTLEDAGRAPLPPVASML